MFVTERHKIVAFGVERWVGGDEVDACVRKIAHLGEVIATDKGSVLVHVELFS